MMHDNIHKLSQMLNLSIYQESKLKSGSDKYNISRLEKRGGVLYAPYLSKGIWEYIVKMLLGRRADLIGQNKTLLQAQRNIKFYANGFHCVRVGRHTYYANSMGQVVSKNEFFQGLKN